MKYSAFRIFSTQLEKLKKHLQRLHDFETINKEIQKSFLTDNIKKQANIVLQANTDEKIFDYNSIVISLYGYWEQYIETVIKEYLQELGSLNTSNDEKNKRIANKYKESLLYLFNKVNTKHPKFRNLTDTRLINAMYIGLSKKINSYIPEAFFQSGGNYNYKETSNCIKRLGFENVDNELRFFPVLKTYYITKGWSEAQIKGAGTEVLYALLDDFVLLRNEVAHGATDGTNILEISELKKYISFLEALANALNDYLKDDILKIKWNLYKANEIKVRHCYNQNKVSELDRSEFYLDINKKVLCYCGSHQYPHYKEIKIIGFRVNNINCLDKQYLSDGTSTITIEFEEALKKGYYLKFEE